MSVRYIRLPELLEELALAQAAGELKKTIKSYQKYDLLILDEWLIRCLTPQESYNLLEVIEARCSKGAMIFAPNTSRVTGMSGCIPIPRNAVLLPRPSWTGSSTIHTRF